MTRTFGEAMANQMKDMAAASKEVQQSKIEIQQKLFSEQMLYQQDWDIKLQDCARLANANAFGN